MVSLRRASRRVMAVAALVALAGCTVGNGPPSGPSAGSSDAALYEALTDRDVGLAVSALQKALEREPNGTPVAWRNDTSDNGGAIEPLNAYVTTGGYPCRDYLELLQVDGREARLRNTACRDDSGQWVWVG